MLFIVFVFFTFVKACKLPSLGWSDPACVHQLELPDPLDTGGRMATIDVWPQLISVPEMLVLPLPSLTTASLIFFNVSSVYILNKVLNEPAIDLKTCCR